MKNKFFLIMVVLLYMAIVFSCGVDTEKAITPDTGKTLITSETGNSVEVPAVEVIVIEETVTKAPVVEALAVGEPAVEDSKVDEPVFEITVAEGGEEEKLPFVEIETDNMIKIPRPTWNAAVSSIQGMIELKHPEENAVFECEVEKGYFFNLQTQQLKLQRRTEKPGSTIYWHPSQNKQPIPDKDFINIVLKIEGEIIGYAVIGVNRISSAFYEIKLLKSVLIPKINGEFQAVTAEQIKAAIEKAKGN